MRIGILGKFPPIQGGVSAQTFRTACDLAARGHEVHVVTNASEVEAGFHIHMIPGDEGSAAALEGAKLHVHHTAPLPDNDYIPWTNPYGSKLFGKSLEVFRDDLDLVLGWYLEPYGLVAAQVCAITGTPLVLRHAGSDLGRLAKHRNLRTAYRWALSKARAILSGPAAKEMLLGLGAVEDQLIFVSAPRIPNQFFGSGPPLDVDAYAEALIARIHDTHFPETVCQRVAEMNSKKFTNEYPSITMYGKIGTVKGSYDILAALERLAMKDIPFHFVSVAAGTRSQLVRYLEAIVQKPALARRTWVLPPIAPWKVPDLLRAADIACFLERGFPISIHSPRTPWEILAAGKCLVLSGEIAGKAGFSGHLTDMKNAVIIDNPQDTRTLSDRLEILLTQSRVARTIGFHGRYVAQAWNCSVPSENGVADALERLAR